MFICSSVIPLKVNLSAGVGHFPSLDPLMSPLQYSICEPQDFNRLLGPASDKEQWWKSFSKMVQDSRGVKIQAGGRKRCQWDLFVVAFVAGVLPLTIILCCLFVIFTCVTSAKLRHITIRKENMHKKYRESTKVGLGSCSLNMLSWFTENQRFGRRSGFKSLSDSQTSANCC